MSLLATRLYLPRADAPFAACRSCWGLSYESRCWNYKDVGLLRALGLSSRDLAMRETSLTLPFWAFDAVYQLAMDAATDQRGAKGKARWWLQYRKDLIHGHRYSKEGARRRARQVAPRVPRCLRIG